MYYLYKTQGLAGQVLLVVFLLAVLGAQVVSAQDLPPCTNDLNLTDSDNVPQAMDVDKNDNGLIEICDLEGLYEMRYALDGSGYSTSPTDTINRMGCRSGGNCIGFELTRSLDFTDDASYRSVANTATYTVGSGWEPIGTFSNQFNTRFEGNGHTISNLRINRNRTFLRSGLFGVIGAMANIANIGLRNVRIMGDSNVGGLAGFNSGSITNSYATGPVEGTSRVGGLVGENFGSITNSYATGSVEGMMQVGGLVGENINGSIMNSYATGSIEGMMQVGGLVGDNTGPITNSYATGSVEGASAVGGLVGFADGGSITNSYATGSVEGTDQVGGLVGFNLDPITNSYATGSVTGNTDVGGLVGRNNRDITNSYATGSVIGIGNSPTNLGGLVGTSAGSIMNSYATGFNILVGLSSGGSISNSSATTIVELRMPTTATGIYSDWSTDVWDFGTPNDRPTLKNNPEIALVRIRTKVFLEGPLQ